MDFALYNGIQVWFPPMDRNITFNEYDKDTYISSSFTLRGEPMCFTVTDEEDVFFLALTHVETSLMEGTMEVEKDDEREFVSAMEGLADEYHSTAKNTRKSLRKSMSDWLSLFNRYYYNFYENGDAYTDWNTDGGNATHDSYRRLVQRGDEYMFGGYKGFAQVFMRERGDALTSDREVAAFARLIEENDDVRNYARDCIPCTPISQSVHKSEQEYYCAYCDEIVDEPQWEGDTPVCPICWNEVEQTSDDSYGKSVHKSVYDDSRWMNQDLKIAYEALERVVGTPYEKYMEEAMQLVIPPKDMETMLYIIEMAGYDHRGLDGWGDTDTRKE